MAMKIISFNNGMHITVPDEEERAVVFASSVGGGDGSFTLDGPEETVMSLILELTRTALQESQNKARRLAFVMIMTSVLAKGLKEKKTTDSCSCQW